MISVYQLKPRFQALLRPGVARLAAAGVTANGVTLLAMVVSCALGALLFLAPQAEFFLLLTGCSEWIFRPGFGTRWSRWKKPSFTKSKVIRLEVSSWNATKTLLPGRRKKAHPKAQLI